MMALFLQMYEINVSTKFQYNNRNTINGKRVRHKIAKGKKEFHKRPVSSKGDNPLTRGSNWLKSASCITLIHDQYV